MLATVLFIPLAVLEMRFVLIPSVTRVVIHRLFVLVLILRAMAWAKEKNGSAFTVLVTAVTNLPPPKLPPPSPVY